MLDVEPPHIVAEIEDSQYEPPANPEFEFSPLLLFSSSAIRDLGFELKREAKCNEPSSVLD